MVFSSSRWVAYGLFCVAIGERLFLDIISGHFEPSLLLWEEPEEESIVYECGMETAPKYPHLEFVHVPKTGGTFVEDLAAKNGIEWGICRHKPHKGCSLLPPWANKERESLPNKELQNRWTQASEWHTPLAIRDEWPTWAQESSLFMVVRNPYDRIISEWKYANKMPKLRRHYSIPRDSVGNTEFMNAWIQELLEGVIANPPYGTYNASDVSPVADIYYQADSHLIPQMDYWVPDIYVLRMETLNENLKCLLQLFDYDWEIPLEKVNEAKGEISPTDLSPINRVLIEHLYSLDFEAFGYELLPEDDISSTG